MLKSDPYGEKKTPLTKVNYLEVQGRIPAQSLKIRKATEVKIDISGSTEKDVLANIDVGAIFKGSINTAYKDLKEEKLVLVKLEVDNENMKEAVNQSPKVLDDLIEYGGDARITDEVWIVMDATLARSFTSSTSFNVSVNAGIVKVTAEGKVGSSGTMSVTLSEGTTFAYGLVQLDWDANLKKNKTKVVKLSDDQQGSQLT